MASIGSRRILLLAGAFLIVDLVLLEAGAREQVWSNVCTFEVDDVSFSEVEIANSEAHHSADSVHADRATLFLEQNGVGARARVHMTAPLDIELTTKNFGFASLSLRAGAEVGGVVKADQSGVVRVIGVGRTGRTMDLDAGYMAIHGLPLRCEDLIAVKSRRSWLLGGMSHTVLGVRRIYARPEEAGFAVDGPEELPVSVDGPHRGDWVKIRHKGSVAGGGGFEVDGWVRAPRIRAGGASGGGAIFDPGFRSCARGSPVQMALVTLEKDAIIFVSAEGDRVWKRLTSSTRALVALYSTGRAAIAGLPGWSWPRWQCETGWVDSNTVHFDEPNPRPSDKSSGDRR